jgi:nucleoside-diphosphate-sugar epimerase
MEKVPDTTRNIWVLGGTGFIGSSLVKHLSGDPKNKLHLLVHKNISDRNLEKFNTLSGSLDRFDLTWFKQYPPEVLFHLARMAGPGPLRRQLAARRGERANERLANYLMDLEKPPVVVYVSGSLMYGNQYDGIPADEYTSVNPVSYGRHYIRAEIPWLRSSCKVGLTVKLVRPGWIIGPSSWFKAFFWDHYLKTGLIPVYGDGSQLMSVIHLEDLGEMVGKAAAFEPDILNLFVGNPVTQRVFSKTMADILETDTEDIATDEIRRKFGKAEAEALTSTIPLSTRFPELWKGYEYRYPRLEDMLIRTISLLKGE